MPHASSDNIRTSYGVRGRGPALLLLNHIGASGLGWRGEFLAELEGNFRLIIPDQRGTGASDKPDCPYLLADVARDALAVLDAEDVSAAHVLGLSMGGAVAQELALAAPKRVRGLVLVSTFCGPRMSVPPEPPVLKLFEPVSGASRRDHIVRTLAAYHSGRFIEQNEELLVVLTEQGSKDTPLHTLLRQNEAIQQFDTYDRLAKIPAPTLVIHGADDPIIPPQNARILGSRIPNAQVIIVPDVGHLPMTEQPQQVAMLVSEFLLGLPAPGTVPRAG